jgi:hypothetical protein
VTNEGSQEFPVYDRRNLLRKAMLTGFGAVVIGVTAPALARGTAAVAATRAPVRSADCRPPTAPLVLAETTGPRPARGNLAGSPAIDGSTQPNWSFCNKCKTLFYGPEESTSSCQAGGIHNNSGSFRYRAALTVTTAGISTQPGWSFCNKCKVMFYGTDESSSHCATGGTHNNSGSDHYITIYGQAQTPTLQTSWKFCGKCKSLFYGPEESTSRCPEDDGTHGAVGTLDYGLAHDATTT